MDPSVRILSVAQQETLSEEKIDYKIECERYLRYILIYFYLFIIIIGFLKRNHPELSDIIRCLFHELVSKKPATKAEVLDFICTFFQQPDLKYKVMLYSQQRESDLSDYDMMMAEN